MNFIDALKKCDYTEYKKRPHAVTAKNDSIGDRVKIYRTGWANEKYPILFVWVTEQNIPMASIGGNQSMPLLLEVPDFIADDWEILEG